MSSKDVRLRLHDIMENADRIAGYVAGLDVAGFVEAPMVQDAVERCLERIAEAVVKIGALDMAWIAPDLPFERVRGLGNMLRHAYDTVDAQILFALAHAEIPALRRAAQNALDD